VRQYTRSEVPVVCAKYGWEEITSTKRADVVDEITKILHDEFAKRHLSLVSFGIREVHLPQSLQEALTQKITAQQASEEQKYSLAQAQVKAEQDVAQATGQANAVKAQAEGDAQAILTKAKAQAEANGLLAQSLTPSIIQYQGLVKWDGRLPLFMGTGGTPLIDVSRLTQPPPAPAASPSPSPAGQ
jgi:regulator of protease activity HflC (stomatin/prohibitin superfamily)